jgi:hypothetical protein
MRSERSYAAKMTDAAWRATAKDRARRAKVLEIEAHKRAIELHEQAAAIFDRLRYEERAQNARERAERTRQLLQQALAEQAGDAD